MSSVRVNRRTSSTPIEAQSGLGKCRKCPRKQAAEVFAKMHENFNNLQAAVGSWWGLPPPTLTPLFPTHLCFRERFMGPLGRTTDKVRLTWGLSGLNLIAKERGQSKSCWPRTAS